MSREADPALSGMPATISGYRLEGYIGRGDLGVVYLAQDEREGRQVALKIIAPEAARDEVFRARFLSESQAAAGISHPNIIPVYQAGEADGALYVAMRYVQGGDARSLLGRVGPLPPAWVWNIVAQVGAGLDAAHASGLVHGDVKPASMLLDSAGQGGQGPRRSDGSDFDHVFLSDFGMRQDPPPDPATGQFAARLGYAAPEQIEGRPLDGRADLYSLACACYELLCGTPPFGHDQGLTVLYAQLYAAPPSATAQRPELPGPVDQVLARALAKNPGDRYASCAEFAGDLHDALGLLPAEPAAPSWRASGLASSPPSPPVAAGPTLIPGGLGPAVGGDSPGLGEPQPTQALTPAAPDPRWPSPDDWQQPLAAPGWQQPAAPDHAGQDPGGQDYAGQSYPVPGEADWQPPAAPGWQQPVPQDWPAAAGGPGWSQPGPQDWAQPAAQDWQQPTQNWPQPGTQEWPQPAAQDWPQPGGQNWPQPAGQAWQQPLAGAATARPGQTRSASLRASPAGPGQAPAGAAGGLAGLRGRNWRLPADKRLLYGAAALVGVIVLIVVAVALTSGSKPGKATASAGGATPSASAASGAARQQAAAVTTLLNSSAAARKDLATAVGNVRNCKLLPASAAQIHRVVSQRSIENKEAETLAVGAISNGATVKADLVKALQDSLNADHDYLVWARRALHAGCTPNAPSPAYNAAFSADEQAAASKQTFVRVWNPLAAKYGTSQETPGNI